MVDFSTRPSIKFDALAKESPVVSAINEPCMERTADRCEVIIAINSLIVMFGCCAKSLLGKTSSTMIVDGMLQKFLIASPPHGRFS